MGIRANTQATRQVAGATQEQLAAEAGVSRQAMAKRKAGKVVGIVLAVVAVVAIVGVLVYRDGNLHAEERAIERSIGEGFVEKQVSVDGSTVNYAEGPDNGPALMLVHGQDMEWEDFASVLPELSGRYHVFAVDCFGHGESEHDPALYSCNANGDALIAFAHDVIGGLYTVSGHSSGGIIAAYVAASDAANVTALVLEDPPLFRVTPEEARDGAGTFAWHDGYTVAHSFLQQRDVTDYAACPTVYLKATTRYGDDGVLYAATTDDDAARVSECLADCEYVEIDSGHDIHVEHPGDFIAAISRGV